MPSKTMLFGGCRITASRPSGGAALAVLVLLIVMLSVVVPAAIRVGEAIAPTIMILLYAVPGTALAAILGLAGWRIAEHRRTERDALFVQRKLAAELAAELPPPPPVRVDCTRTSLPAAPIRVEAERLTDAEQTARGLAALEAAARRVQPEPVDLDELIRRRR